MSEHREGMLPVVESVDVSQRDDLFQLRGRSVGLMGVLFLTVTGAAPISAMLFNTPIAVGFGNGIGAPAGFLVATIVLTIFSVGYVAMSRKVTASGGFYSFISHGLNRELGMASGFSMVAAYSVFEVSLVGGFAYFASLKAAHYGWHVQWYWCGLFMIALICALSYLDVRISARILGVALLLEVVTLVVFDAFVFTQASGNVSASAINPLNAFKSLHAGSAGGTAIAAGAAGIGIFFAFWSWVGFEMAPNYGEESRDPKRNIPRAMYISVIGLGVFYTITSWASLAGYPSTKAAVAQSQNDAAHYFLIPASQYAGHWVASVMSYLIITGSFACGMAFHNTTARYLYSVGRDGLAPRALGRTHPRWKSPHIASIAQSVMAAIIIGLFAIFTGSNDPNTQAYIQLYGLMAVMGVIIILSVQAVVSLSVLVYFERFHKDEVHWWRTRLAPLLSFISQAFVVYLLFTNIDFLGAGSYSYANWLGPIDAAVVLIGVGTAFYFKKYKPAKYEQAGRLINDGL